MNPAWSWRLLVDGARAAAGHMAYDEQLAGEEILTARLFRWDPPAVSLGFKQARPEWLESQPWRRAGLECVERPTGGGVAFHGSDVSLAVIVPRQAGIPLHALMRAVCDTAVRLCRSYGLDAVGTTQADSGRITYCLTQTSPYAVHIGGRKAAGFALRRFPHSWLVQGSLLADRVPARLAQALPRDVNEQLGARAVCLAEAAGEPVSPREAAERWAAHWSEWWHDAMMMHMAAEA